MLLQRIQRLIKQLTGYASFHLWDLLGHHARLGWILSAMKKTECCGLQMACGHIRPYQLA